MKYDYLPYLCFLILCLVVHYPALSQNTATQEDSISNDQDAFLTYYPLLFYFPETRLGFGAALVYNYYPGKIKSSRPSQWQLGAAYTLNKQILLYASYQYFLRQNRTELFGELGYYDYFYFFYGIGNETKAEDEETYFVRFPRFRIHALEEVVPNFRAGISYKFDQYDIYEIEPEGILDQQELTGFQGSTISTLGVLLRFDTRDNINLPRKGYLATFSIDYSDQWLGASFDYNRLLIDLIKYQPIGQKQVLALNLYFGQLWGNPPFQELLFLGGSKKGRGIVEGRFRDRSLLLMQGAYRFPLFGRFRGTLFASMGKVDEQVKHVFQFDNYHFNYGLGLRFLLDPAEGIQLRLDVGFGSETPGFYFTVGEAF